MIDYYFMLQQESAGITGNITFDVNGRRTNYSLNVNEIYQMQMRRIASWESKSGKIVFTEKFHEIEKNMSNTKEFIVGIASATNDQVKCS